VGRVRDNVVYETIEERTLCESDRQEGIRADRIVRASWKPDSNRVKQPLRLVEIHVTDWGRRASPPTQHRSNPATRAPRKNGSRNVPNSIGSEFNL